MRVMEAVLEPVCLHFEGKAHIHGHMGEVSRIGSESQGHRNGLVHLTRTLLLKQWPRP